MIITNVETFTIDGGWRPWIFVKVETDEGVVGYGECTDPRSPHGVLGTIKDLTPVLIGQDPGAYEMRFGICSALPVRVPEVSRQRP